MALVVKSNISLEITNGTVTYFRSGPISNTSTQFTQSFGADIVVPTATVQLPIYLQNVDRAQTVLLWSDKAVEIFIVLAGSLLSETTALKLLPGLPSLLAVENIIEIYCSNNSGQDARVVVQGVGVDI